jgi:hypothetical protein
MQASSNPDTGERLQRALRDFMNDHRQHLDGTEGGTAPAEHLPRASGMGCTCDKCDLANSLFEKL